MEIRNTYSNMGSSGLDIVKEYGTNVGNFSDTMRVGEDDNVKSVLELIQMVYSPSVLNKDNFQVDNDGNVHQTSLQTNNTSLVPSITQGYINIGQGNEAKNSGILYFQQV